MVKRKGKKQRSLLYMYIDKPNCLQGSGIDFDDFLTCIDESISSIIFIESIENLGEKNYKAKVRYMEGVEDIIDLSKERRNCDHEFAWLDANSSENISELSRDEVSTIRDMQYEMPNEFVHFECIDNKYIFFNHDYGWYFRICFRDYETLTDFIVKTVQRKIKYFYNKIENIDIDYNKILQEVHNGIFIDFEEKLTLNNLVLPLYSIAQNVDIDHLKFCIEYYKNKPIEHKT